MLDYDYIKNYHRLTAVDLSRKEELDTDLKAIEQVEFAGQLKRVDDNDNAKEAGDDQSIQFFLNSFRKNKRNTTKIFSRRCNSNTKDGKLSRNES